MPSPVTSARSATHGLYAGASPPTVDVGMFTIFIAGVDLKTAGTSTVFTVPTGRTFIATWGMVLVTAVNTGGAGTENLTIKESSGARTLLTALAVNSHTPVANQSVYAIVDASVSAILSNCTSGNSVQAVITTSHAGSTSVSGSIFVTGYYSS